MPLVIYGLKGEHMYMHRQTYQCSHESNFKKPGTFWPTVPSLAKRTAAS